MTQTNSQIREKIEEEFKEILEYGKNLKGEEVWTDSEKMHWLRKKLDSLLKTQREEDKKELIEKCNKFIEEPERFMLKFKQDWEESRFNALLTSDERGIYQDRYATQWNRVDGMKDIINLIKESK